VRVCVVAGARPNFMKIAPVVRALTARGLSAGIIHTGQHYDERMSDAFFRELDIPQPFAKLEAGSGTPIAQTAEIMKRLEPVLVADRPDWVVVVGDVNSTVAAAMATSKLGLRLAHVEAGLRSFDRTMPEELNRIVTDALSDRLFASEPCAVTNLQHEGIDESRIFLVGNVMIDTLQTNLERARAGKPHARFDLEPGTFALVSVLSAIDYASKKLPVLLPLHPRTRKRIDEFGLAESILGSRVRIVEPLGYLDMIGLIDKSRLVLTDSGGMQEETTFLRVPCITLRENTERPITVEMGSSRLVGSQYESIVAAIDAALSGPGRIGTVPSLWDGRAAERIAENLAAV
jgi:UDP-N-acetylglucosamine 2-epimerase (non-hydrolysing)